MLQILFWIPEQKIQTFELRSKRWFPGQTRSFGIVFTAALFSDAAEISGVGYAELSLNEPSPALAVRGKRGA